MKEITSREEEGVWVVVCVVVGVGVGGVCNNKTYIIEEGTCTARSKEG
jgi:hypothetical protein